MPSLQTRIAAFADSLAENIHALLPEDWSLQNVSAPISTTTAFQPSFINFFVSPYFLVLLFLSIVINRIHAIVSPRNAHILPFLTKLGVRTPSIFLLCKSVAILLSFLSSVYEWRDRLPSLIAEASTGMKGGEVLWATFKAMSAVTITETFLSCIERRPSPQEQTVSLFEWALMLYFTSSGNEIFVVAFIQVCQLLVLQLTFLHPRGHAYRLIPTTIFGLIGLAHFCYSLWTLSPTYPYLQFLARVPELMVVCITIVSIFIHLLAMKVGNFRRHMFEPHSLPGTHEDYAVAIFKLGSACLEATRGVGYRNEAESIRVPVGTVLDRRPSIVKPDHKPPSSAFGNEMPDDVERTPEPDVPMYQQARLNHIRDFCGMCIQLVKGCGKAVKDYVKRIYRRIVYRTIDMPILPPEEWGRWREGTGAGAGAGGEGGELEEQEDEEHDSDEELFRRFVADDWRLFEEDEDWEDKDYPGAEDGGGDEDDEAGADDAAESNFAAAPLVEELLDLAMDMREQDMPSEDPSSSTPASSSSSSSFFALIDSSTTPIPTPLLSLFIAHYLHPTTVTRTRYRKMTTPSTTRSMEEDECESHTLAGLIQLRRPSLAAAATSLFSGIEASAPTPSMCVVCQSEQRTVLLRPCCCLVLCNECRENMAARRFKNCPCCRRKVEGYSRIYLP